MIIIVLIPLALFADSYTFSTSIDGVNNGLNGFGLGLFPIGTSFSFSNYAPVLKGNFSQMLFNTSLYFSYSSGSIPSGYSYKDGTPAWSLTTYEKNYDYKGHFISGTYFKPTATLSIYAQQGFGKNPVAKSGPLVYVRATWNTRYSIALEGNPFISSVKYLSFVNSDGTPKEPFGPGTVIPTMPWLQDSRESFVNNIALSTYWYFYKSTGTDASDGLYAELTFEYGPSWLANTISPKGVNSNYWRAYAYLDQRLTLFTEKQADGKNWATMYIGHSNSLSYVGGDVVPEHKLPGDRLRHSANDSIWIHFAGPQFIAGDCYSYIRLTLSNNVYWGKVANELSQTTKAVELQSSFSTTFHLRLFGFIRFDYTLGYVFNRGIYASDPYWWQSAELRFYVAV